MLMFIMYTGFKYISEILNDKSHTNEKLLLAFEESNGYMVEPFVRDKDALQIVPLIIKFKNLLYENNITLKIHLMIYIVQSVIIKMLI